VKVNLSELGVALARAADIRSGKVQAKDQAEYEWAKRLQLAQAYDADNNTLDILSRRR
jgi:hypothetical protein